MPQMCPRQCGRLATAAVLISVGVVQLIAGLILIRSKYVYLLSAPNFWTAAANFAVGALLGISASVWKETQKISSKHTTRRNLLASLVMSSLLINGTTTAILVLGEGNSLLSIKLETSGIYSNTTLASELLAYAFAASVCSPIVSIVVACIFLSGLCFRRLEKNIDTNKTKNILNEDDAYVYSWVFRPKLGRLPHPPDPTIVRRALSSRFLSSSTDDDDSLSSPDTVLHRSNSLPSVDGSLLNVTRKVRARSESNVFKQASQESNTADAEQMYPSSDRNKESFVNESFKSGRSLPRHFEAGGRANQKVFKARSDDSTFQFSKRYPMYEEKNEPYFLDKNSHGVEIASGDELDRYRESLRQQPRSDYHSIMESSSVVTDVHTDIGKYENDKIFANYNNSAEESTLVYEADSSSSDVFARFENDDPPCTKSNILRTSTAKSLKSLEDMDRTKGEHQTVHRTSTAINSKSADRFQDVEDSKCNISNSGETESIGPDNKSAFNNVSYSSVRLPKQSYIVDDSFDIPTTSHLAGEIVPIQVSTLPRKLSSKLVPVCIPEVSGTRRYSLKAANSIDNRYLKNKNEKRRRSSSVARTSKFHAVGEPKLLSFRGESKTNAKERQLHKAMTLPRKHASTRSDPTVTPELTTCRHTENSVLEIGCSSPAHTSGYMSALEDTLNSSDKSRSTETSIVSPSTFVPGSSISQTHHQPTFDGWNSKDLRSSLRCNAVKEVVNPINKRSSAKHSKEKLIDQLLNDPSFQKIMMQTLKETEI